MCDGLNHWVLEVTWAQQDHGSVFNIHPNLPKKTDISAGFRLQVQGQGKQQLTPMDRELRAESMLEHQLSNFSSNSKVTAPVLTRFFSRSRRFYLRPDWKQMDLSGLLRQVSRAGGWAVKCSQLLGRAPRKLLELGPSSEVRSGASAKKEKVNFSKTPFSENLKKQGFWNERK